MTRARQELKYLFPREFATRLATELNRRLTPHHFVGEGSNARPLPQHFVTTLYFDTADGSYFRAAVDDPQRNDKLRLKDYYDRHPNLVAVARSKERLLVPSPFVWLEYKRRVGDASFKQRVRLPRTDLSGLLQTLQCPESERANGAFVEWLPALSVRPVVAVNYRRLSWQDAQGNLRLTLDLDVAFHPPPDALPANLSNCALSAEHLGPRAAKLDAALLEVKTRGETPGWLDTLLRAGQQSGYSKFRAAREALEHVGAK